jgi:hypothetical protein
VKIIRRPSVARGFSFVGGNFWGEFFVSGATMGRRQKMLKVCRGNRKVSATNSRRHRSSTRKGTTANAIAYLQIVSQFN